MASTGWGGDRRGQEQRSRQPGEASPGAAPLPREAINFAYERQRHAGFVGRSALLAQLDQQLINDTPQRWVVVTGGPGMGKSALLAAWLARREAAGDKVPHHFIRRAWANWDDPDALVGSLVTQIEARYPDVREPEADARLAPAARLAAALLRASERALMPRGERLVLLIDGLEYDPRPGSPRGDPLAALLPYALPPGVSVLCASRPRHPYVDSLATRGVLVQIDLDDAQSFAADNAATVRAFWEQAARELGLDAAFVVQAVERADGNLEHAAMLCRQLAGMPPEQRKVEDIPRGLGALIASAWERIAIESAVVDGLGILCAAREPLSLDELGWVARWTGPASRQAFVRSARELLIETQRDGWMSEYRLHHDSIRAHIAKAIGTDALAAHHLALAERLASWPAPAEATARHYALHHALLHRAEAGAWADAWRVAADVTFLEAKCREVGVRELASGREVATLQGHTAGVNACAVTPDRRHVVSASYDRTLKVWELESGRAVATFEGHTDIVTGCAVTPDGRHMVSASYDQTLKVWELASGRAVATLEGHTAGVNACAVTPDGRHVVSASADQTLKVWDLATCSCRITHRGDAAYHAVAVSATTVNAGDRSGVVWFLGVPPSMASPQPRA